MLFSIALILSSGMCAAALCKKIHFPPLFGKILAGIIVCTAGTKLVAKERLFCALAYMPKATVQAAIGGLPLAMGLACGNIVLTVSVLAILVTPPLGAFAIEATYRKFLERE